MADHHQAPAGQASSKAATPQPAAANATSGFLVPGPGRGRKHRRPVSQDLVIHFLSQFAEFYELGESSQAPFLPRTASHHNVQLIVAFVFL